MNNSHIEELPDLFESLLISLLHCWAAFGCSSCRGQGADRSVVEGSGARCRKAQPKPFCPDRIRKPIQC